LAIFAFISRNLSANDAEGLTVIAIAKISKETKFLSLARARATTNVSRDKIDTSECAFARNNNVVNEIARVVFRYRRSTVEKLCASLRASRRFPRESRAEII